MYRCRVRFEVGMWNWIRNSGPRWGLASASCIISNYIGWSGQYHVAACTRLLLSRMCAVESILAKGLTRLKTGRKEYSCTIVMNLISRKRSIFILWNCLILSSSFWTTTTVTCLFCWMPYQISIGQLLWLKRWNCLWLDLPLSSILETPALSLSSR